VPDTISGGPRLIIETPLAKNADMASHLNNLAEKGKKSGEGGGISKAGKSFTNVLFSGVYVPSLLGVMNGRSGRWTWAPSSDGLRLPCSEILGRF
jgi:hypothetical protein